VNILAVFFNVRGKFSRVVRICTIRSVRSIRHVFLWHRNIFVPSLARATFHSQRRRLSIRPPHVFPLPERVIFGDRIGLRVFPPGRGPVCQARLVFVTERGMLGAKAESSGARYDDARTARCGEFFCVLCSAAALTERSLDCLAHPNVSACVRNLRNRLAPVIGMSCTGATSCAITCAQRVARTGFRQASRGATVEAAIVSRRSTVSAQVFQTLSASRVRC